MNEKESTTLVENTLDKTRLAAYPYSDEWQLRPDLNILESRKYSVFVDRDIFSAHFHINFPKKTKSAPNRRYESGYLPSDARNLISFRVSFIQYIKM